MKNSPVAIHQFPLPEETSSRGERQILDVLTQLLHDQEKSRQMIQEMQEEITQVRSFYPKEV